MCTAVAASDCLQEHKHSSTCPRRKRDGQCVGIFILLSWSQSLHVTTVLGCWYVFLLQSSDGAYFCVTLSLQEWGRREAGRWTLLSLSPSLLQHCMWAKLKCINMCIWGGICAGVGVTSEEDGRVPYVLLHCRFYYSLETCSEILLIYCPKNFSCLAVLGQYCRRFGYYCVVLLSLLLLGCKHWLTWRKPQSPCSLLLMLDEAFAWIQIWVSIYLSLFLFFWVLHIEKKHSWSTNASPSRNFW